MLERAGQAGNSPRWLAPGSPDARHSADADEPWAGRAVCIPKSFLDHELEAMCGARWWKGQDGARNPCLYPPAGSQLDHAGAGAAVAGFYDTAAPKDGEPRQWRRRHKTDPGFRGGRRRLARGAPHRRNRRALDRLRGDSAPLRSNRAPPLRCGGRRGRRAKACSTFAATCIRKAARCCRARSLRLDPLKASSDRPCHLILIERGPGYHRNQWELSRRLIDDFLQRRGRNAVTSCAHLQPSAITTGDLSASKPPARKISRRAKARVHARISAGRTVNPRQFAATVGRPGWEEF